MERVRDSVHPEMAKKATQRNSAKKAIKVVHISNPMKFKTSASEFRALVQKLTGRDSDIADIVSKYHQYPGFDESEVADRESEEASTKVASPDAADSDYVSPFELLEGAFDTPTAAMMQENFPWLMMPSAHLNAPQGCAVWGFSDKY